jgi:hypothetical protein
MALKDLFFILDNLMNRLYESLGEGGRIRRAERTTELLLLFGLAFFLCFLLAGGPYVVVYRPSLLFRSSNTFQATFVNSNVLEEGGIEGLIVGIMYLVGIGGIYWLYTSSRGGTPSSIVAIAAIIFVVIATVMLYLIGSWKG